MGCKKLEKVYINLNSVTKMDKMFMNTNNPFLSWEYLSEGSSRYYRSIPKVTTAKEAWKNSSITSFKYYDFNRLTDATSMFENCVNLGEVSKCSFPALKTANYMFKGCSSLGQESNTYDELTSATEMYKDCTRLVTVSSSYPLLTSSASLFANCSNLILSAHPAEAFKSVTDASNMYSGCTSLGYVYGSVEEDFKPSTISDVDTVVPLRFSVATNIEGMFKGCTSLNIISLDFGSATTLSAQLFKDCEKTLTQAKIYA